MILLKTIYGNFLWGTKKLWRPCNAITRLFSVLQTKPVIFLLKKTFENFFSISTEEHFTNFESFREPRPLVVLFLLINISLPK